MGLKGYKIAVLPFLLILGSCAISIHRIKPQTQIHWESAGEQTKELLKELIRINTVNPPGNELKLLNYVKERLEQEGINVKIFESAPGRGNLVARISGSGKKSPVLMVAHVDTVGFEEEKWCVNPLGAIEKDGYLYGRGAIDDKGMAACQIYTMLLIARHNPPLDRDVILLLNCDEEAGGKYGMTWMIKNHFEEIKAEFAINEGGHIVSEGGKVKYIAVQNSEKRVYNLKLIAKGTSGHSSVPLQDNAIYKLSRALDSISRYKPPFRLNPTTRRFFEGLSKIQEEKEVAKAMEDVSSGVKERFQKGAEFLSRYNPVYNAMLRDTFIPTLLNSGKRFNVLPSSAEATLNARILPGQNIDELVKKLDKIVGQEIEIKIERLQAVQEDTTSPFETELFEVIQDVTERLWPGTIVVPYMSTGATDSTELRAKGIITYGILPFPLSEEELSRMHGHNERIGLEAIEYGIKMMYNIIVGIAGRRNEKGPDNYSNN
jgi:acetylornithine deacetylase/succinyl-diaminopimelate desuccinylase-like protein